MVEKSQMMPEIKEAIKSCLQFSLLIGLACHLQEFLRVPLDYLSVLLVILRHFDKLSAQDDKPRRA